MSLNLSNYSSNLSAAAQNVASSLGGATLIIYSGTQPATADTALSGNTALATFTMPAAGSNTVTNNVVTIAISAWATVTAGNTGTATFFRITNGVNTICDGTVSTSGADLNLNSTSISSGASVQITALSYNVTK
jgi:hypothetical protein